MAWTRTGRRDVTCLPLGLVIVGAVSAGSTGADDAVEAKEAAGAAAIEGDVAYDGPLPEPVPVFEAGTVRHLVEVEPEAGGLKDAVVWLEGVPEPDLADDMPEEEPIVMDQENNVFIPHVLAVEAGREVEFLNSDGANHGVTASSQEEANRFNRTTPRGGSYTHRSVASRYPVAIGCPIHAAMAAWIFVFDHPHFAVTDERGRFRLPPGRSTLQVRHPGGGMRRQQEVVVAAGEPLRLRIEFHGDDLDVRGR